MTAITVVDASAAAVLFSEPELDSILHRMSDADRLAPAIITYELADVCRTECVREAACRSEFLARFHLRKALRIRISPVDQDAVVLVALDLGLSVYDASYLWLAPRTTAALVTLDKRLERAALRTQH